MTPIGRRATPPAPLRERVDADYPRPQRAPEDAAELERARQEVDRRLHIEQELDSARTAATSIPSERPVLRRRVADSSHDRDRDLELPDLPRPAEVDGALALASASSRESAQVHRLIPPGGTLQMLPGRLVLLEGEEAGREIRFVRLGGNPQRITLGRNSGRPYEHVQLKAQTVSRVHARMQYDEGRWYVENLSRTNPLVVNGRAVAAGGVPTALSEGDVIELGEVMCRFHER